MFLRETLKGILQGMRESKIVALFKIVSEQDCMSCHRRLIFMTWYHVLMFVLVEQLWNGMKISCWEDHIIANLKVFYFVSMIPNFAEWSVIAKFNILNAALLPTLMLYFVFAGDMLDLLKWRTHPDKIAGCLSKLKEIDGSEIVKVYILLYFQMI